MNYLPSRAYSWVFRLSMALMMLDFLLCIIWLPIGAGRTYGFRTAREGESRGWKWVGRRETRLKLTTTPSPPSSAFLVVNNGTGAVPGWNWMLSFVVATGPVIGFDASGHVAEETKNAVSSHLP